MNKKEVIEMSKKYSKNEQYQDAYKAVCNIIRCKINTCDNGEFCDEMEELANVSFMDLDDDE